MTHCNRDDELGPICHSFLPTMSAEAYPLEVYGTRRCGPVFSCLTCDESKAAVAGWLRLGSLLSPTAFRADRTLPGGGPAGTESIPVKSHDVVTAMVSRTAPLVGADLSQKHVAFVGTGASVHLIESVVRTGVGKVTLWDRDVVDVANVGRTGFDLGDVGLSKVRAVHRRLLHINPAVDCAEIDGDFMAASGESIEDLFRAADIIVMGTDAQAVQRRGARIGYSTGRPVLLPGFYPRAEGGEVVVVVPPGPCYECQVPGRFDGSSVESGEGTHDLDAEPGLIFDCDHLDSVAGTIIIALLAGEESKHLLPYARQVARTGLILSKHHPEMLLAGDDLFAVTHGTGEVTFAYQTAWIDQSAARLQSCSICGGETHGPR